VDFTYPTNILFECSKCGLCCGDTKQKTRHILLLESEANDISNQTHRPKKGFVTEARNKAPYLYEMKKTSRGKCLFLEDNNNCAIYEHRPLLCTFYPFELKFSQGKGSYIFEFTLECPEIGKGKRISKKDFEKLFLLAKEKLC
jgi:Fe-S-cluster containining protein